MLTMIKYITYNNKEIKKGKSTLRLSMTDTNFYGK